MAIRHLVLVFWQSPDKSDDWEKARVSKKLIKRQASFAQSLVSANGFESENQTTDSH